MKKKLSIILFPLLIFIKLSAQTKYNFKGKVKTVETEYWTIKKPSDTLTIINNTLFDEDNIKDLLESNTMSFNSLGLPISKSQMNSKITTTYKYNEKWKLIEEICKNELWQQHNLIQYKYDIKDRLWSKIETIENYKNSSIMIFGHLYEYTLIDSVNQDISYTKSYDSNNKLLYQNIDTFTYDYRFEGSKIIEKNEFRNSIFNSKTLYLYSSDGLLSESTIYLNNGNIDYSIKYDKGKVISRTYYQADFIRTEFDLHSEIELPQIIEKYTIKIDDVGNWVYRITKSNKKTSKVTTRTITYH
jgi:hypothetical protein